MHTALPAAAPPTSSSSVHAAAARVAHAVAGRLADKRRSLAAHHFGAGSSGCRHRFEAFVQSLRQIARPRPVPPEPSCVWLAADTTPAPLAACA